MNLGNIFSDSLMGKLLLKIILLRSETYNRVDKINMNNTKIVSPEKTGRNHFALAEEIRQPRSRALDNLRIEEEQRHLGKYNFVYHLTFDSVYVPKKGSSGVQAVNQLASSIGSIIKPDRPAYQKDTDTASVKSSTQKFNQRDHQGHDIFGWKNLAQDDTQSKAGKKTNPSHLAAQNNGNLLKWL